MIRYKVRSRDLVDIVNDINSGGIVLSPFFQRNLVWRIAHKVDFIKTILLGFPFPEIFVSRGTLDVEKMTSISCIVDGQQRMNSIIEFVSGEFDVDGAYYKDLSASDKEAFLKYEIAIIDLDLSHDDPKIIDIFKRLNRTFYALSNIEKLSTEYASSDFMLVGKMLCAELRSANSEATNIDTKLLSSDPNITREFTTWGNSIELDTYMKFVIESPTFSKYEISRQVHLMYTLNLMCTFMVGIYARNDQVIPQLDTYAIAFDKRDEIINRIQSVANDLNRLRFSKNSMWYSKSNSFSLLIALDRFVQQGRHYSLRDLKDALLYFEQTAPEDYLLAAREAVNNKQQRSLRDAYLTEILEEL